MRNEMRRGLRVCCGMLAALLTCVASVCVAIPTARAEDETMPYSGLKVSAEYYNNGNGTYYKKLLEATEASLGLSPDKRFVNIVKSQLGNSGYKNEYNRSSKNGYAWCAAFITWCLKASGLSTAVAPRSTWATRWNADTPPDVVKNKLGGIDFYGEYHRLWSEDFTTLLTDYKPQVGDILTYMPNCTGGNCNLWTRTAHVVVIVEVGEKHPEKGWEIRTIGRCSGDVVGYGTRYASHAYTGDNRGAKEVCNCSKHTATGAYPVHIYQGIYHPNWSAANIWNPTVQYAVTLNPNGGMINGSSSSYHGTVGEKISLGALPTTTRDGYTFYGWYASADCTGEALKDGTAVYSDMTLYACWHATASTFLQSCTITDVAGTAQVTKASGTTVKSMPCSYASNPNSTNVESSAAPAGAVYTVTGICKNPYGNIWYRVKVPSGAVGYIYSSDVRFIETPSIAKVYSVTLNANGGTINSGNVTQYTEGVGASLPVNVTKANYSFVGWYGNSALTGAEITSIQKTDSGDKTFYAKWEAMANACKVTLDTNGGSAEWTERSFTYGASITIPRPEKTGYSFAGWYQNANCVDGSFTGGIITGNMKLYAKWNPYQYSVTYHLDGGSLTSGSTTMYYDYGASVSLPGAVRDGFTFAGWYSGTSRREAFCILNNVELTAHWNLVANNCHCSTQYAGYYTYVGSTSASTLGINDGEGYGNGYTRLGSIPNNTTVWISKATGYNGFHNSTGMWGTVTYNGVTGHCSMYYLQKITTSETSHPCTCSTQYAGIYTVSGTKNGYLAINDGEGYLPELGFHELGQIPEGQSVVISKATGAAGTSGKWGLVTYNGITGHCSMAYLKKQSTTSAAHPCNCSASYAGYYQVLGTSSGFLAINDGEGYLPSQGFTQLGTIDEGTVVYITKATGYNGRGSSSGMWGCVTHNGISGHCAMNYLERVDVYVTIAFDANGGSVSSASQRVLANSTVGSLPTPVRSGYRFTGWFEQPTNSIVNGSTRFTTDVSLLAGWERILRTVAFDANGGSADTASRVCGDGDGLGALPVPANTGYVFDGWYTAPSGGSLVNSGTPCMSDMTLYAHWSRIRVTVSFDAAGGSQQSPCTVDYGSALGQSLPSSSREGYAFLGWYTSRDGGAAFTSGTQATASMTVFARWQANDVRILLDPNGGSITDNTEYAKYDAAYTPAAVPTWTGYVFKGWYSQSDGGSQVLAVNPVRSECTLYAHWEPEMVAIRLNNNESAAQPTVDTLYTFYDSSVALEATPTRAGYDFNGWYTQPAGGAKVTEIANARQGMTLYASWTPWYRDVIMMPNYEYNDDVEYIDVRTVEYNTSLELSDVPSRFGYSFEGWYTEDEGGQPIQNLRGIVEDTYVYAHWSKLATDEHTLFFDACGGQVSPASVSCVAGSTVYDLPIPSKSGCVFLGWSLESGQRVSSVTVGDGDVTLYALWCKSVVIPAACREIADGAFSGNVAIECIDLRNVAEGFSMGEDVFAGCANLKTLLVNKLVTIRRASAATPIQNRENVLVIADTDGDAAAMFRELGFNVSIAEQASSAPVHSYKRYDGYNTWEMARAFCESVGGHLATITSPQEQARMGALLSDAPRNLYFIGCTDKAEEGSWKWITGEEFAYANWHPNQPDNFRMQEHYMTIYGGGMPSGFDSHWNDSSDEGFIATDTSGYWKSYSQFGFICEWE